MSNNETPQAGTHTFAGQPDARQSERVDLPVSRFRPQYRALTEQEKALHDQIKTKAAEMETLYNQLHDSRYKSLAMTSLEESVMWIVKAVTA